MTTTQTQFRQKNILGIITGQHYAQNGLMNKRYHVNGTGRICVDSRAFCSFPTMPHMIMGKV